MSPIADERVVVVDLGGVVCRFAPAARLPAHVGITGPPADDNYAAGWGS